MQDTAPTVYVLDLTKTHELPPSFPYPCSIRAALELMGRNLADVESVSWALREDGMLSWLTLAVAQVPA